MPHSDPLALLPHVRTIAKEAGQVILRFYNDTTAIQTKDDGSPVTAADHAAEAIILPALHHLTPDIPVISEEAFAAGRSPAEIGDTFWLVDPLDGTKSFIQHTDEFTVNIALVVGRAPALGVIHVPVSGETYAAAGPGTAVLSAPGRHDRPLAARPPPAGGLVVLASRSQGDKARLQRFLAGLPVHAIERHSSAFKFCLLARGDADLYPRFGRTGEWDTAAGHALLLAAGGRVETEDGAPLGYGKPGFVSDGFIAYGRR